MVFLSWAFQADLFTVREVKVTGLSHVGRSEVVRAARLGRRESILAVDGDSIRRDLEALPWVRTASVQAVLPDRVQIAVGEWPPVAVYRNGPAGKAVYLNDQGAVLAPAAATPTLPLVQGAGSAEPRVGTHPIDPQLLAALVRIEAAFPALYGQPVATFQLDCVGSLSLVTAKGVTIYFGRVLTPEQYAALSAKLSALKSIVASDPSVADAAKVEYINLEDVQQPAVKFKGDRLPTPSPGASPSPAASPAVAPTVTPCG